MGLRNVDCFSGGIENAAALPVVAFFAGYEEKGFEYELELRTVRLFVEFHSPAFGMVYMVRVFVQGGMQDHGVVAPAAMYIYGMAAGIVRA